MALITRLTLNIGSIRALEFRQALKEVLLPELQDLRESIDRAVDDLRRQNHNHRQKLVAEFGEEQVSRYWPPSP